MVVPNRYFDSTNTWRNQPLSLSTPEETNGFHREDGVCSVYGHQEGVSVGVERWALVEDMEDGSERKDVAGVEKYE